MTCEDVVGSGTSLILGNVNSETCLHLYYSRWLILKDSYLIVLKPHKVDQNEDGKVDTGDDVTARRDFVWSRHRRWRFVEVILMDQFFRRKVLNVGNYKLLQISNMHR